jgi:hypothetical protein
MAGERRLNGVLDQAGPLHVDDAVEHGGRVANLACDSLGACVPETELMCWHIVPRNPASVTTVARGPCAATIRQSSGTNVIKDLLILIFS